MEHEAPKPANICPPYADHSDHSPQAGKSHRTPLTTDDTCLFTCEHGGNRIPPRYRPFFDGHEALLHTHRGYDIGALRIARELAAAFDAPLLVSTVSRLLIDLNRSPGHPRLYSEVTRNIAPELRHEILARYYRPYRAAAESRIAQAIGRGARVIHISCHSFTPELGGELRDTDIGLLYDPARAAETGLCRRWRDALKASAAVPKTRMNYPYAGTADGFTTYLRKRFPADRYLGIELEINQKYLREGTRQWHALRMTIIETLRTTMPVTVTKRNAS